MTAEQRVKLVWPQAVREVRGGIVSPGIWEDSHPMANFLGETWEEVSTFDRVVKAHERYIRELSEPAEPQSALCNCDLLPNGHELSEHPASKEEPELFLSWTAAQKACEGDYQLAYVEIERKLMEANRRADELAEQLVEMCKLATKYQNELWAVAKGKR